MRTVDRQGVHIEQCENCRGIFLDHGELEHMLSAEDRFYGASSHYVPPGGHREARLAAPVPRWPLRLPGGDVDLVELAAQRWCVEHRSDAQHLRRVRHVGLELLRHRDERASAGVVDVAEPLARREPEPGSACVRDGDSRGEHLDQRPAPEDRVRGGVVSGRTRS